MSASGRCTGCGRPGVPYEYRGCQFDGLCAYWGDRLCPPCRDARMAETGADILVVSCQPQIPPHVINTVRDRDVTFAGSVFPEQLFGLGLHPGTRKTARWKRAGLITVKEQP